MPFIDGRDLPAGSELVADLVVIGAGVAGLAIAREWAGAGRTVALIESGGRDFDAAVQDLYKGEGVIGGPDNPDRPFSDYVAQSRRRQLGGSGLVWGGKCVALDPADFARRDWVKGSGWPLSRKALQPYYDRACDLLEIDHFPPGETALADAERPELVLDGRRRWFSAPRRFTRCSGIVDAKVYDRYRTDPVAQPNVTCWLNSNVTEIRLAADARSIDRLDIACLNGKRHTARGRFYVLAAGGIENARLLLASNSVEPNGVGNRADLVGRYFQGHVTFGLVGPAKAGVFLSGAPRDIRLYAEGLQGKSHCVFAPRLSDQRRRRSGNATFTLGAFGPAPRDSETLALQQLANGIDAAAGEPRPDQYIDGFLMTEHLPNPESRITLGSQSDALGMPRVRLEWRYSAKDWRDLEASVAAFAAELAASGTGRLRFPPERGQLVAGANASRHHMGATRMSADPAEGVVDTDARVHGLANLYIAGSSIFPTSGIGNPTLTLLAYAMRLSDHLKTELKRAA
jgi:choline dehydrogenase-like flavoprotein